MKHTLTKATILLFALAILVNWAGQSITRANQNGSISARTGAVARGNFPAEPNCTECHVGSVNLEDATVSLALAPTTYQPNQEVSLTLSVEQPGKVKFGFQGTALDQDGNKAGDWIITDAARTKITTATAAPFAGRSYIGHTFDGAEASGAELTVWKMKWRAPLRNVGRITFYFAVNAANGNFANTGDAIYTTSQFLNYNPTLPSATTVSAASFLLDTQLSANSIAALFGTNLTNEIKAAETLPLPTTLADAQVRVRDANNVEHEAPLFFVAPGQINFLVPPNTANGRAQITVRLQNSNIATGSVMISDVASALFSANADGQGIAAGLILRAKGDGSQSYESLAQFNQTTKRFEAVPIDLGPATDQVFLILYGTGFRNQTATTCTVGGQAAEVLFAGAQGDFAGLDQLNLRLPRTLVGQGNANINLRSNNQSANTVVVNIK